MPEAPVDWNECEIGLPNSCVVALSETDRQLCSELPWLGALGGGAAEAEVFDFDEFVNAVFGAFATKAGFWTLILAANQMGSGQSQFSARAVALA